MVYFVLLCGGKGTRVGLDLPKQYFVIGNKPVFMYSIDVFNQIKDEKTLIIAAEPQYFDLIKSYIDFENTIFVESGETRQETVYNCLKSIRKINENDIILIHDSPRIYVDIELVETLINEIKNGQDSAIPYKNQTSALFDSKLNKYISTQHIKVIETPQAFNLKKLKESYKNKDLKNYKDDGSIFINKNKYLNFVYNSKINTKITTSDDLIEAERKLK